MLHQAPKRSVIGSSLYEYAFVPVPQNQNQKSTGLFYVLAGYTSALSCLVLGAKIGMAMPFWQAIGVCFLGDLFLILLGTSMGILSAQTGWSTTFLVREVLGKSTSIIFSLLIIICSIFWIGVNGNLFTVMLISVFPSWPLPSAITAMTIIAIWAKLASIGWKGLESASRIVVPCSLIPLFYTMFQLVNQMGGTSFLFTQPIVEPISFSTASTAVIGNFVFGCIITPDTCRFAHSPKKVISVCPRAYIIGLFLFNVCGIIIAKAGGFSDFIRSAADLGLIVPIMLCSIFCLITTQNINIYGGSLAIQNIFQKTVLEGNVSHKVTTYLIAGLAAALSVFGIGSYIIPLVSYFSILMMPLPGMLFAEILFFQKRKNASQLHWYSMSIWVVSSCMGLLFFYHNLPFSPFWGMLFSGTCYVLIHKWLNRKHLANAHNQ